ncbi:VapD [Neisseria sp.]|uniref:VapD n=1 Tax=Neisseria sp. TaxID=192066 RepID=UPI0026DAFF3C|nr:VapD [Neisseria sp.]MDO4908084.1 VapD [Neisseria sp.]
MSKYLIAFDLSQDCLRAHYHANSPNNAYYNIATVLKKHGFNNIQGSVYISMRDDISEAHGTLALQEVAALYDWFAKCVSNVKFYRLEADLDAQFIVDGVEAARTAFIQQIQQLRQSLLQAGLSEDKLNEILNQQNFAIGNINLPLNKMKNIELE